MSFVGNLRGSGSRGSHVNAAVARGSPSTAKWGAADPFSHIRTHGASLCHDSTTNLRRQFRGWRYDDDAAFLARVLRPAPRQRLDRRNKERQGFPGAGLRRDEHVTFRGKLPEDSGLDGRHRFVFEYVRYRYCRVWT
ncbi:MAG: hypothetical protein BJ554DRAFT_8067 [Olpidium bornovanus]|uniref:Uncharacterized protein n=1 Tax=Olpidium bornovanus TaxID=278681 RepID=A0A8H8DJC6_9FUNG|nr:MAG: hypothetical protein BJ554DRAFT_8067 [Olpidium bornovanus]